MDMKVVAWSVHVKQMTLHQIYKVDLYTFFIAYHLSGFWFSKLSTVGIIQAKERNWLLCSGGCYKQLPSVFWYCIIYWTEIEEKFINHIHF